MHALHAALAAIRNFFTYVSTRNAGFWAVNLLIAVVIPSPIAAPVLYARFRRARHVGHPAASPQRVPA
jgi:hypothetical protein